MSINILSLPAVCTFLVLSFASFSSFSAHADKAREIDNLMNISGINALTAEMRGQFNQGIAESNASAQAADEIRAAVSDGLSPQRFQDNIRSALNAAMDEPAIQKLNHWYNTDIGKKITALEVAASSAEQSDYVFNNMDSLLGNQERVAMARRIEDIIGGGELASSMMKSMQVTMVNSFMQDAPADQRQAILQQIDQQLSEMMPQVTTMMLASYVHTYANLSDIELNAYLDFLATPEATQFYKIMVGEIGNTLGNAVSQIGTDPS